MTDNRHARHTEPRAQTGAALTVLVLLVALQLAAPVADVTGGLPAAILIYLSYIAVLSASTWLISNRWWVRIVAVVAGVLAVAALVIADDASDLRIELWVGVAAFPVVSLAFVNVLSHILSGRVVTRASLIGTAVAFLLVAHSWSAIYAAIALANPDAFTHAAGTGPRMSDLMYFSLVTQTTLGYGDIAPASRLARALASLQAVTGLFFMAVIVARFTGRLDLSEPDRRRR